MLRLTLRPASLADMGEYELLDLINVIFRKLMGFAELHSDFPSIVCSISPMSAYQSEKTHRQDERREV
jgi:hypothetical protein